MNRPQTFAGRIGGGRTGPNGYESCLTKEGWHGPLVRSAGRAAPLSKSMTGVAVLGVVFPRYQSSEPRRTLIEEDSDGWD